MTNHTPSRGKTTPGSNSTSFKTPERGEGGVILGEPVVPVGDLLGTQHTLVIEPPVGDYPYDRVEVSRGPDDEDFTVIAVNEVDLVDDFAQFVCEHEGIDPDSGEYADVHEAVTKWIAEDGGGVRMNQILTDVYGGENDDARDWDMTQAIGFETTLPADATSDQILYQADYGTRTEQFLEDYESQHFFREALVVQHQRSPDFSGGHMSADRYDTIVSEQIGNILAGNRRLASAAPQAPTKARERDANEALVAGRERAEPVEGRVNGRARVGDHVEYQVPGQQYPVKMEVLGLEETEPGTWMYRVKNTDTGDQFHETMRGKFWKKAPWMLEEANE